MISAQEAKAKQQASISYFKKYEKRIEELIVKAAENGEASAKLYIDDLWASFDVSIVDIDKIHKLGPQLHMVIKELHQLGYGTTFGKDGAPYVPRGLADDNGDGPLYVNWVVTVYW